MAAKSGGKSVIVEAGQGDKDEDRPEPGKERDQRDADCHQSEGPEDDGKLAPPAHRDRAEGIANQLRQAQTGGQVGRNAETSSELSPEKRGCPDQSADPDGEGSKIEQGEQEDTPIGRDCGQRPGESPRAENIAILWRLHSDGSLDG